MQIQPFARQLGTASPRQALEDEMKRKSLMRQLETMHAQNPDATVQMATGGAGRTPSLGPRGGGGGGAMSRNDMVSRNNPGKIDVPDIDRHANAMKDIELENAKYAQWQARDAYKRANPTVPYDVQQQDERDRMFKRYDDAISASLALNKARDAEYAPPVAGSGKAAPDKAAETPKQVAEATAKFEAAKQLHDKAKADFDAAMAVSAPEDKRSMFEKIRGVPAPVADMEGQQAAAEALAKAKAEMDKAEANLHGATIGYGSKTPIDAAPSRGRIIPDEGGGAPLLTNRPQENIDAAMAAKFGGTPAKSDEEFAREQAMFAPSHGVAAAVPPNVSAVDDATKFAANLAAIREAAKKKGTSSGVTASY